MDPNSSKAQSKRRIVPPVFSNGVHLWFVGRSDDKHKNSKLNGKRGLIHLAFYVNTNAFYSNNFHPKNESEVEDN